MKSSLLLFMMLVILLPSKQAARPLVGAEVVPTELPSTPPLPKGKEGVKVPSTAGGGSGPAIIGVSHVTNSGPSPGEGH
ncbi:unnamed protein product [Linum trigynum]